MIYLIDDKLSSNSHSKIICDIINEIFKTDISIVEISMTPTYGELYGVVLDLSKRVLATDIVLCPWSVSADYTLDLIFSNLADLCYVIAAAGNNGALIDDYSPARAQNVVAVGCLNKSLRKASCSNFSKSKPIEWIVGTSYVIDNKLRNGTSISSAIYTALLAKYLATGSSLDVEKDKYNAEAIRK